MSGVSVSDQQLIDGATDALTRIESNVNTHEMPREMLTTLVYGAMSEIHAAISELAERLTDLCAENERLSTQMYEECVPKNTANEQIAHEQEIMRGWLREERDRAEEAEKRIAELRAENEEQKAKLRAATDLLATAEKIAPGLLSTSSQFAIGDVANARERAEAAEKLLADATEALERIEDWRGFAHTGQVRDFAHRAARNARLAAPQKDALKPPKELPPMWESTDGGYSKEEPQKEAGA